jgi:hypothetical protein
MAIPTETAGDFNNSWPILSKFAALPPIPRWLKRFVAGVVWVRISGNPCGCYRTAKRGPWNCAPGAAWNIWNGAGRIASCDYYVGDCWRWFYDYPPVIQTWLGKSLSMELFFAGKIIYIPISDGWLLERRWYMIWYIYVIRISKHHKMSICRGDPCFDASMMLLVSTMNHPLLTQNYLTDNFFCLKALRKGGREREKEKQRNLKKHKKLFWNNLTCQETLHFGCRI